MPVTSEVIARKPGLPALVLVHGLGSAGNIWKTLHAGLEDTFTFNPLIYRDMGARLCMLNPLIRLHLRAPLLRHLRKITEYANSM